MQRFALRVLFRWSGNTFHFWLFTLIRLHYLHIKVSQSLNQTQFRRLWRRYASPVWWIFLFAHKGDGLFQFIFNAEKNEKSIRLTLANVFPALRQEALWCSSTIRTFIRLIIDSTNRKVFKCNSSFIGLKKYNVWLFLLAFILKWLIQCDILQHARKLVTL